MILKTFDFCGKKRIFFAISLILIAVSLISIFTRGFNFGVDFSGGTELIFKASEDMTVAAFREKIGGIEKTLEAANISKLSQMGDQEQNEHRYSVTTVLFFESDQKQQLEAKARESGLDIESYNSVSGFAAEELRSKAIWIVILVSAILLVYITIRFRYEFSIGAILALLHDAVITLGFYSLFQISFDVSVIAAILTLLGYSINATIVIYDRVRENLRLMRGKNTLETINTSIRQTMTRTVHTSVTTFIVVFMLLVFGGISLRPFAFGLTVGVIVGTYSSVFIASPLIAGMLNSKKK
ncbi:MAG TPA: protein translocase subunit SecF [Thermotogota bacterium]|nr:protein translocase subunit SecF [Thermotogota bacterium]